MTKKTNNKKLSLKQIDRLHVLGAIFFLGSMVVVLRLFDLQVMHGTIKQAEAFDQRALYQEILPRRGAVYSFASLYEHDELQPLAINEQRQLLYAVPYEVVDPESAARQIADALHIEDEEERMVILEKLQKRTDPYEPIQHSLVQADADRVLSLALAGIYTQPEVIRTYPMKESFGHITGFLGFSENSRVGQYGIEGRFEPLLAGTGGFLESEQDPAGRVIVTADRSYVPAEDGADVILTIDPNIQEKACTLLQSKVEKYQAEAGVLIVMDPKTGAIHAMCNSPEFDPNHYSDVESINVYMNRAVTGVYEPGSIFKAITMSAALDSGSVKADTTYEDTGELVIGDHTIRNADNKIYHIQNMSGVLENSINTGSVFAATQTGKEGFRKYVELFGFGEPTNIELPVERTGDISSLNKRGEIYLATASFGQGITVTPIQMVQAFGAIANQGKLVRPYVVSEIRYPDGRHIVTEPEEVRRVVSTQTAAIVSAMLVNVIEKGHGQAAHVPGFYLAGKTGTAEVASGSGYGNETIHSFVGFGPISEPRYVALIRIDKPQWGEFSANTVAPAFAELSSFLLQYYQVPPER